MRRQSKFLTPHTNSQMYQYLYNINLIRYQYLSTISLKHKPLAVGLLNLYGSFAQKAQACDKRNDIRFQQQTNFWYQCMVFFSKTQKTSLFKNWIQCFKFWSASNSDQVSVSVTVAKQVLINTNKIYIMIPCHLKYSQWVMAIKKTEISAKLEFLKLVSKKILPARVS